MRENDMVAIMLFSPEASLLDLEAAGINSNNTGIKEEKEYLKIKEIQESDKFKDEDGNFSDAKFHNFYTDALRNYNVLAAGWQPTFHENNIFAPAKQRRSEPEFMETTVQNPFMQTASFKDLGEWGPQTKSVREIAEGQKVYNTETGKWMDAPEDSFFGTIGMGPLVLATWDYDADEKGNPTKDPSKIKFKKGEYKLNDNGTFYYETLGNRSSHGKSLLHYSDIITKEDSKWNKIDFLDSDDLEKSVMGSVAKNVALVGSLFLPGGVGYAITAATILQQSLKLGATLGKMLTGSEAGIFNKLEAISEISNFAGSVSDHAQENLWSWENLVKTAGDAISQLRQQRILFEAVPWALGYGKLGKGKGLFSAEGQEALRESLRGKYNIPLNKTAPKDIMEAVTQAKEIEYMKEMRAMAEANAITKDMTNLSAVVSKAYMTGITVNDMYAEAKEAGMGDMGAMAMTLGYAAAEYRLLSTGIGEMILPELRAQRMLNKQLLGRISEDTKAAFNKLEHEALDEEKKKGFFWKAFNFGKKLYEDNRSGIAKGMTNAVVAGVGEGLEEVSEELLADAIRGLHDLGNWSSGKMFESESILDRYAMNFIGGLIGGGVNGLATDFSVFNRVNKMTSEQAMKELIHKLNNGEAESIKKDIENTEWASKDLSATKVIYDDATKSYLWQQAENEEDSQNEAIKIQLRNQIDSAINVLEANGARLSDPKIFDYNTLKEARFSMLANTSTAARYSEVFAERTLKLVENYNKQKELDASLTDEEKRNTESEKYQTYIRKKQELEKERKELVKKVEEIKEGKEAARFIGTALLEIHPAISQALMTGPTLDLFVQRIHPTHKSFRELSDEEKTEYIKKYKDYKSTQAKEEVIAAFDTWEKIMDAIQSTFAPEVSKYEKEQDKYSQFLDLWLNATNAATNDTTKFLQLAELFLGFLDNEGLVQIDQSVFGSESLRKDLEDIDKDEKAAIDRTTDKANHNLEIQKRRIALIDDEHEEHEAEVNKLSEIQQKLQDITADYNQELQQLETDYEDAKADYIDSHAITEEEYDDENLGTLLQKKRELEEKRDRELSNVDEDYDFKLKYLGGLTIGQLADEIDKVKTNIDNITTKHSEDIKDLKKGFNASRNVKFFKYISDNFGKLLDLTKEAGYLSPVTKDKLRRSLERLNLLIPKMEQFNIEILNPASSAELSALPKEVYEMLRDMNEENEYLLDELIGEQVTEEDENGVEIPKTIREGTFHQLQKQLSELLDKTPDSPVLKLLDQFALDITGKQTNFSSLFKNINDILNSSKTISDLNINANADQIEFDGVMMGQIEQALKLIDLLYSVLMGARADSAGFEKNQQLSTGLPTFGFNFGLNTIINEVKAKMGDNSKPLLTIEGNITDNIVRDLHLLSNNLKFLYNLHGINSGQKLGTQSRITLHTTQLIYKALERLCSVAPDDVDTSAISGFFNEGSIIKQNLDKRSVDDATLAKIEEERIKLEDALYQFGQDNKGKNVINLEKYPELFKPSSLILNETTSDFDISTLAGYLASRFAIKSSEFYNSYRQIISDKVAPLSIQEFGIYLQTANAVNGQAITEFKQTLSNAITTYLRGLNKAERKNLYTKIYGADTGNLFSLDVLQPFVEHLLIPLYDNVTFLEGIAGSGKTRAVMLMTKNLLDSIDKTIMDKAFIVDTSEDNAKNLAEGKDENDEGLGLKGRGYKAFSKESLLKYISDWREPEMKDGKYVYIEGTDYIVEDGVIKAAYNLKEGIELPSIIVIDEIGRYTDLELETIDKFAKLHGISVLAFGDLDQTRANASPLIKIKGLTQAAKDELDIDISDDTLPGYETNLSRIQLIHGPKLGFSMRTRNKQQDKNQEIMLAKLIDPVGDINLSYYEGEDKDGKFILNGAKVVNFTSNDLDRKEDEILELVEKLIPTLGEKEKIGVIYQSKDSSLYTKLIDKFGIDRFDFYEGNTAQGREARYFIYETGFNVNTDNTQLVQSLYTGITRAQNGIIILTQNPGKTEGITNIKNNGADQTTQDVSIDEDSIKEFSRKRKKMYDDIFGDRKDKLDYKKRNKVSIENVDKSIPQFELVSQRVDGDKIIVEIKPYDLKDSKWLAGSRTLNKVTQLTCNLQGYDVQLVLSDGTNQETIPYNGHISDLVQGVNVQEDGVDPDLDPPQDEDETENIAGQTNAHSSEIEPEIKLKSNTQENKSWDLVVHTSNVEKDPIQIMLYTLASMETGLVGTDLSQINSSVRIDSMRGLYKMMSAQKKAQLGSNDKIYEHLYNTLLKLHKVFIQSDNKPYLIQDVSKILRDDLGLNITTDANIQFGLWTSSRANTQANTQYGVFERTRDPNNKNRLVERSDFNEMDTDNDNIHPRNISAAITFGGKTVLLPLAFLSSPLTIARSVNDKGQSLYPEVLRILNDESKTMHDRVLEILQSNQIYTDYPSLYNLFKLYNFTHNGFFPLKQNKSTHKIEFGWIQNDDDEFTLQQLHNFGLQIITNRGMRQFNKDIFQEHIKLAEQSVIRNGAYPVISRNYPPVVELLKNKQMRYSEKVYMFKQPPVGLPTGKSVLIGRPFILVSEKPDDPNYITDDDLYNAWLRGDTKVRLVYLLPPILNFNEYISRLLDFDKGMGKMPGNNVTSYHILSTLLKTTEGKKLIEKKLEAYFSDGIKVYPQLISIIEELDRLYDAAQTEYKKTRRKGEFTDFVNKLKSPAGKFFKNQNNLYDKLNKILRLIVDKNSGGYRLTETDDLTRTIELDPTSVTTIENAIKDRFVIYDSVRFDRNAPINNGMVAIQSDASNNYMVNGKYLLLDTKVTTPTFGTDGLNLFIDSVVNSWIHKGGTAQNMQTGNNQMRQSLEDEVFDLFFNGNIPNPSNRGRTQGYQPKSNRYKKLNMRGYNPQNEQEEEAAIDDKVNKINSNKSLKYILINDKEHDEVIKVEYNDILKAIKGEKSLTVVENGKYVLTIGDKSFNVVLDGTNYVFQEIIPEPDPQTQQNKEQLIAQLKNERLLDIINYINDPEEKDKTQRLLDAIIQTESNPFGIFEENATLGDAIELLKDGNLMEVFEGDIQNEGIENSTLLDLLYDRDSSNICNVFTIKPS